MIQPIGHFRLWRELFNKPIWLKSTLEQKVILITLVAMANFKPKQWEWKGKKYEAKEGQFVTSLDSIVTNTGGQVSAQNVRTALKRFEKLEFLTSESTKEGRLITLVNWGDYQHIEELPNIATNKDLTKSQQRPNKDLTTREEGNKVNKVIKKEETYSENPELNKAWIDFIDMRKKIKAPLTDRALVMSKNKLNELTTNDNEKIAILNQSTMNCWKGLFEIKSKKEGVKSATNIDNIRDFKPSDLFN